MRDPARNPGRSVADCAADTARIADHLGADRFYTMGQSGGGPHALACAALLPDRVIACATTAGVGPLGADGLDFLAGMAQENIDELGAAVESAEALEQFLLADADKLRKATASDLSEALGGLVSPVDVEALTGEFAEHAIAMLHECDLERHRGMVRRRHRVRASLGVRRGGRSACP